MLYWIFGSCEKCIFAEVATYCWLLALKEARLSFMQIGEKLSTMRREKGVRTMRLSDSVLRSPLSAAVSAVEEWISKKTGSRWSTRLVERERARGGGGSEWSVPKWRRRRQQQRRRSYANLFGQRDIVTSTQSFFSSRLKGGNVCSNQQIETSFLP